MAGCPRKASSNECQADVPCNSQSRGLSASRGSLKPDRESGRELKAWTAVIEIRPEGRLPAASRIDLLRNADRHGEPQCDAKTGRGFGVYRTPSSESNTERLGVAVAQPAEPQDVTLVDVDSNSTGHPQTFCASLNHQHQSPAV